MGAGLESTSLRADDAGKCGPKRGQGRHVSWDYSHPFRRAVRPASMRFALGRELATLHVLPSLTLGRVARSQAA